MGGLIDRYTHTHPYLYTDISPGAYIYTQVHVCVCIHTHRYIYILYIYFQVCMHACIHTHTHTHAPTPRGTLCRENLGSACPNASSKPASIFPSHRLKGKRGAPIFSCCNLGPRSVDLASFYYSHMWHSSFPIVIHWHIVTAGDKGRRRQSNDTKHKVLTWSLFLFGCLRLLEAWIQFCCLKQELPKWLTSFWEREHWLVLHMPVFHLSVLTARTRFLQFIPGSAADCIWGNHNKTWKTWQF